MPVDRQRRVRGTVSVEVRTDSSLWGGIPHSELSVRLST